MGGEPQPSKLAGRAGIVTLWHPAIRLDRYGALHRIPSMTFKLTAVATLVIALLAALWNSRETAAALLRGIVIIDYRAGAHKPDPTRFRPPLEGDDLLSRREPIQGRCIERWRGGEMILQETITLVAIPATEAELQAGIAAWRNSPQLKFDTGGWGYASRTEDWPEWFPTPPASTHVGTITTSDGFVLSIYRRSQSDLLYVYWRLAYHG